MDIILKQRMVGAIVLISLGVIFIPMLLSGKGDYANNGKSNIPTKPKYEIKAVGKPAAFNSNAIADKTVESEKKNSESNSSNSHVIDLSDKAPAPKTEVPASEKTGSKTAKTDAATSLKPTTTASIAPPQKAAPKASKQIQSTSSNTVKLKKKKVISSKPSVIPRTKPKSSIKAGWIVQVGSFEKRKNANQLRDKLRTKGFAAFVEPRKGETPVYRVRIGPEAKRQSAEKLQRSLLNKQKLKGLVLKYP